MRHLFLLLTFATAAIPAGTAEAAPRVRLVGKIEPGHAVAGMPAGHWAAKDGAKFIGNLTDRGRLRRLAARLLGRARDPDIWLYDHGSSVPNRPQPFEDYTLAVEGESFGPMRYTLTSKPSTNPFAAARRYEWTQGRTGSADGDGFVRHGVGKEFARGRLRRVESVTATSALTTHETIELGRRGATITTRTRTPDGPVKKTRRRLDGAAAERARQAWLDAR
jgi:hypothetical protein